MCQIFYLWEIDQEEALRNGQEVNGSSLCSPHNEKGPGVSSAQFNTMPEYLLQAKHWLLLNRAEGIL